MLDSGRLFSEVDFVFFVSFTEPDSGYATEQEVVGDGGSGWKRRSRIPPKL